MGAARRPYGQLIVLRCLIMYKKVMTDTFSSGQSTGVSFTFMTVQVTPPNFYDNLHTVRSMGAHTRPPHLESGQFTRNRGAGRVGSGSLDWSEHVLRLWERKARRMLLSGSLGSQKQIESDRKKLPQRGKVLVGRSVVNESMLTGESIPVFEEKSLTVSAETVN
ncbi:hypothetical protein Syun_025430 [Stephania yunnanensis]|uniref:Uncharacterized protein n=1 Tax=Stephania yunnanensis TaxID=152371 RepID=A0AAP0HW71_9MAGN